MNIVICTHARIKITSLNIESLLGKAHIILVVSDDDEVEYYSKYPITIVQFPNFPLGAKWQRGVDEARKHGGPLMILGSDDILESNCIEMYNTHLEAGHWFIGLSRWWQHYKEKAYLCDYLSHQPLGGGRCYSDRLLTRVNYSLFHVNRNRLLDDRGWMLAKGGLILNDPLIHAVKGDWPVLNRFDPTHRNVKVLEIRDSKEVLPIVYDGSAAL